MDELISTFTNWQFALFCMPFNYLIQLNLIIFNLMFKGLLPLDSFTFTLLINFTMLNIKCFIGIQFGTEILHEF